MENEVPIDLPTLLQQMQDQLRSLQDQLTARDSELSELRSAFAQQPPTPGPAQGPSPPAPRPQTIIYTDPSRREPDIADPEKFSGKDRRVLPTFISKCRLKFAGQPSKFDTEDKKIFYAGARLEDPAYSWFQPLLTRAMMAADGVEGATVPPDLVSFDALARALERTYGEADRETVAEHAIKALKQTGSVATYISEFQRHSQYVRWNDAALYSQFYDGLKETMKREVMRQGRFATLEELQAFASRMDVRYFEFAKELRQVQQVPTATQAPNPRPRTYNTPPRPFNASIPPTASPRPAPTLSRPYAPRTPIADGTIPMEVDNVTGERHLTQEEKDRRRALNLCGYCAAPDHGALNCPLLANKQSLRPRFNSGVQATVQAAATDFESPLDEIYSVEQPKDRSGE